MPTQIEQTGKVWKVIQATGALAMGIGLFGAIAGGGVAAGVALGLGLLIYTFGALGGWWCHG